MRRLLMGLAVASLVVSMGGCIFLDAEFEMTVDGGTNATFEVGILKSLAEQGEGEDPTMEITEGLAEGKWEEEQFDRDQWRVSSLKGQAGPGESLFAEDADMQPEFATETHLFSTIYGFTLPLPEDALGVKEQIEADVEAEGQGEVKVEGMEGAEELMGDLAAMMMTGGQMGLHFAVTLPGRIIATNGETTAPNRAAWSLDLAGLGAEGQEALVARSRLVNWESIGRMGPRLAAMGRYDLVPALIAAVERGVVPDPATDAPLEAELDAALYAEILDIMVALDAAVGPELANAIMLGLQLNADSPDPAAVRKTHERVSAEGFAASVEKDLCETLIQQLGAP